MKNKLFCLLAALALTGCVNVPKTIISGAINGVPFSLTSPKDSKLTGLEITAQTGGLTNYMRISVQSLEAKMNPEVITTTADGQVKLINAVGSEIRSGMAAAAKGAAVP